MSVQNARPITDRNEKEKKFTDLTDKHDLDKRYAKNCRGSFLNGSVRPELTFSTFSSKDDNAREQFDLFPGISLFRWFECGQN